MEGRNYLMSLGFLVLCGEGGVCFGCRGECFSVLELKSVFGLYFFCWLFICYF